MQRIAILLGLLSALSIPASSHALGFIKAREVALRWAGEVEKDFGMDCTYEEGDGLDTLRFKRSGVQGELLVTKDAFELNARLGFLLGAFKDRIEAQIVKTLASMAPSEDASLSGQPVNELPSKVAARLVDKSPADPANPASILVAKTPVVREK